MEEDMETEKDSNSLEVIEGSGEALIDFLAWVSRAGYVHGSTVAGFKTASRKVLQATQGESWEKLNVTNLDPKELQSRFANLTKGKGKFDVASVAAYMYRFETALEMYKNHLANPLATPALPSRKKDGTKSVTSRSQSRTGVANKHRKKGIDQTFKSNDIPVTVREMTENQDERIIRYPFPLRGDLMVWLQLPADLTFREARRLTAFVESLAVDVTYASTSVGELEN